MHDKDIISFHFINYQAPEGVKSGADPGGFKGFHGTPLLNVFLTRDTLIEQSNRDTLIEQSQ